MDDRKPHIVIIGAGLGGCFLADSLADSCQVTIVELGSTLPLLQDRVCDKDKSAVTYPHICSGLGGTTKLWHNGLIEIHDTVFEHRWPFRKSELAPYYEAAFFKLAGRRRSEISDGARSLLAKYVAVGFPESCFGDWLYYPKKRINPWYAFNLSGRVNLVEGEAVRMVVDSRGRVRSVLVRTKPNGPDEQILGDIFVLAAGGLGTPLLLNTLNKDAKAPIARHIGFHYEDHPCALVGELVLDEPLYKLWNYPCAGGNLRLPLVLWQDGLQVSFQLRPAAHSWIMKPHSRVKSVLSDLRNKPFTLAPYIGLLTHWDDIMEVLSFKLGVNLPTRHYQLLMVAEQPPSQSCAVWRDGEVPTFFRRWIIQPDQIHAYEVAFKQVLNLLGHKVATVKLFPDWQANIFSSSHHSGTARMAGSEREGVCDMNGLVFGSGNLYVCDGSAIPGTGIANTGLTIAALALRLASHLREHMRLSGEKRVAPQT
ncbi:MAG: hypothetical protein JW395_2086 [Nitrospira sp.]|nr:hypothetical protein [Nitrospira sp.]